MDPLYTQLLERLSRLRTAAVAFSGGADSALLLAAAQAALGAEHVLAVTAVSPYMVRQDIGDAVALAAQLGVRHELVEMPLPGGLKHNPPDRCYRCKRVMLELLTARATELGFPILLDGSNTDDAADYRPGHRALRELGVPSPLAEAGIDKARARAIAHTLALPTWDKPANACLLTRLCINASVSMERLQQIEEAERLLLARGYTWVRVRCHDELARVEVAATQRERLLADADAVTDGLRALGFRYVTMDLTGYQLGSMNELPD